MPRAILPLVAMEKLLKKMGAERVSDPAKIAMREELEKIADSIGEKAVRFARHSKRKTIKPEDIRLAVR
ncbi:MAG: histone [Nanoarchaeota archaeon]